MPMPGEPVPTLISGLAYPAIFYPSLFGSEEVISYALPLGPVPSLTSDPTYLPILYPSSFGPEQRC